MSERFPPGVQSPWLPPLPPIPHVRIPMSLRIKLLIALAAILIPSLIVVLFSDLSDVAVRRADVVAGDRTTAETVASLVDASIDDAVAVGQALATTPSTLTFDPRVLDPRLQALRPIYLQFVNVGIVNAQGQSVGEMLPYEPDRPRVNVADRPYFQRTMEFNSVQVSPIVIGRRVPRPTAVVSVPVDDASGRPVGAVLVSMDLEYFRAKLWSVPLSGGRVILITDPTGRLAFASNRWESNPPLLDLSGAPLIRDAIHGVPATQQSGPFPLLSGSQLGAAVPSPRYQWVAAVLQPASVAEGTLAQVIVVDLASFLLALVLGIGASLYLSHQIIGPILTLGQAARAWSRGDLGVRVTIRSGDELERLGDALDEMAASLARTLDQLAEADNRLTQERNRLSAILQTSPAGIIGVSTSDELVLANAAAERLLGIKLRPHSTSAQYPVLRRVYRPNGTVLTHDELPTSRAMREGVTIPGEEIVIRRPNGYETHLLVNAAPLREASGQIVGSVAAFFDITPLVEEERLRSEFVASAAHEFRHPLTVVKGYAEVALRNPAVQGTSVCHELEMIVDAADRANRLADQLLKSAQVHLPAVSLHREPIDLAKLARDEVARFEATLPKGQYHFVVETRPAEVEGDPGLLAEALADLLKQAEEAMPRGGEIGVCVSAWDGIATTAVADHGPTVPPEAIPYLFRPFGVVPSAATEATVSRPSLLLYLAKRIVEESGGWIRAESSPAKTTISFSLPRRAVTPEPSANGQVEARARVAQPREE